MLAQRIHSAPNGGDVLAEVQIQPLNKGRVNLPAVLRQPRSDRSQRAADHPVVHPYQAPSAHRLEDLRVEQAGPWQPARLGPWPFRLRAFGLLPVAIMSD